jgi:hypothetical protein
MDCIAKKFPLGEIEAIKFGENWENRLESEQYYRKLGSSMVGLAIPGVGYDTYRLIKTLLPSVFIIFYYFFKTLGDNDSWSCCGS